MNWDIKILRWLFFIGVFFIPFNSFNGIPALGEFQNDAASYFFIIGFVALLFFWNKRPIHIPYKNRIFQLVILFAIWCFVASLVNVHQIYLNYFKQTSGISRFIRQYISLLLSAVIFFIFYWNVLVRMGISEIFLIIRKVFLASLVIAFIYGVLETAILIFEVSSLIPVIKLFNYFPFLEVRIWGDRISSVSYEPPFLAIYLITITGWMFSYIYTSKGFKKFIPLLMVLFLTFFSGSRTALIVITAQLIVFLVILFNNRKYRRHALIFLGSFAVIVFAVLVLNVKGITEEVAKKIDSLDFKENLMKSVSNKSRIGIQYASFQVFKEHPITGVGYGQQAYHSRFHYPVWSTMNNYEFRLIYKNQYIKSFPPGYNLYLRILTETGVIGFIIYMVFLILIFRELFQLIKSEDREKKLLAIVLLIGFIGICINSLQIDSFRIYGFWIYLALLIKLSSDRYNLMEKKPH